MQEIIYSIYENYDYCDWIFWQSNSALYLNVSK